MGCYTPLKAVRYDGEIVFGQVKPPSAKSIHDESYTEGGSIVYLPCGRCIGCRNDLTKDWAVRCYHEAQMHDVSCVLTLTFDETHLNKKGSLFKPDIQKFLKRVRKKFKKKFSYLYCGEYGSRFERPHYHIILFGLDFIDKTQFSTSKTGDPLYNSPTLDCLWGFGHAAIGTFSMSSAMYCASYITKYVPVLERAEIYGERIPEFGHASKKPALGLTWLKKYHNDILAHDSVIINAQFYRIPRYYLKKIEELYPEKYEFLKIRRENSIDKDSPNMDIAFNKFTIAHKRYFDKGHKSLDNRKRFEYMEMLNIRRNS